MITKRLFLILVGGSLAAILSVAIVLEIAPPRSRRYRSDSVVVTMAYTNALLTRSFESKIIKSVPGVLRLRVTPTSVITPGVGAGGPVPTNAVCIEFVAVGATPEDAQHAADEAAKRVRTVLFGDYGILSLVVSHASVAREYSFFNDTLEPTVSRVLNLSQSKPVGQQTQGQPLLVQSLYPDTVHVRFLGMTNGADGASLARFELSNVVSRAISVSLPGFVDIGLRGGGYFNYTNMTLQGGASVETHVPAPTGLTRWRAEFLCGTPGFAASGHSVYSEYLPPNQPLQATAAQAGH